MALYHIHRPQTFSDIVGQTHIVTTLKNQVKNNKTAHAYLFSGPRGVGKTTTARILAKSLNCEKAKNESYEPCNTCETCKEISQSRSIDVIEIDAASHTGVDNVRQNIIENAQFKPTKSPYKIFIIDEVHMLSTAAFNALLKTLEEPPSYVMFILATTDPHKLPATIISRCQRFNFTKVADDDMKKHLKNIGKKEGIKIADEVLSRVLRKSEGCARDAISLLDQLMAGGDKEITIDSASLVLPTINIELQLDITENLAEKNQSKGIAFINNLVHEGISLPHFATELIEFLRALMIAMVDSKLAERELDLSKDAQTRLIALTKAFSQTEIVTLIDMVMRRTLEIKSSPIPQLPLEMLIIEWCGDNKQRITNNEQKSTDTAQNNSVEKKTPYNDEQNDELSKTKLVDIEENVQTIKKSSSNVTYPLQGKAHDEVPVAKNKTTLKDKVKNIVSKKTISKQEVENNWQKCVEKLEKETPSLVFILKMAQLLDVSTNTLKFAVQYSFHQEKLMEKVTKARLEEILSNALETKVKIDISVSELDTPTIQNKELQDLASALGGEVVT